MSNIVFGATRIVSDATEPTIGHAFEVQSVDRVFQIDLSGLGAFAVVAIDVSCNGVGFDELYSVEISDNAMTGSVTACLSSDANFSFVRARVVSIAGGSVTVYAGD